MIIKFVLMLVHHSVFRQSSSGTKFNSAKIDKIIFNCCSRKDCWQIIFFACFFFATVQFGNWFIADQLKRWWKKQTLKVRRDFFKHFYHHQKISFYDFIHLGSNVNWQWKVLVEYLGSSLSPGSQKSFLNCYLIESDVNFILTGTTFFLMLRGRQDWLWWKHPPSQRWTSTWLGVIWNKNHATIHKQTSKCEEV